MSHIGALMEMSRKGRVSALKALCNVCYHVEDARAIISSTKDAIIDYTRNILKTKDEQTRLFTLKLLFFVTIGSQPTDDDLAQLRSACYAICIKGASGEEAKLYALRVLYNICNVVNDRTEIEMLSKLALNPEESLKVRGSAVNLLLKASDNANDDNVGKDLLLSLLSDICTASDKELTRDYYPSVASLLVRVCKRDDGKRRELRKSILPNKRDSEWKQLLIRVLRVSAPRNGDGNG